MSKYIDADKLKEIIKDKIVRNKVRILSIINFLQQEQPDFPTTDEEIERLLATHPKVEVPNKYKAPDWLWEKQEQPEVDLEKEIDSEWAKCNPIDEGMGAEYANISIEQFDALARHFYELRLTARKEEDK